MASERNNKLARGARLKAEADFATWLMMGKLGSFDDLPASARVFLTNYQGRLKTDGEKRAASATIAEIAASYYAEMGGTGTLPAIELRPPPRNENVVQFKRAKEERAARPQGVPRIAQNSSTRRMPALLIFIALAAVVVLIKYLLGELGD